MGTRHLTIVQYKGNYPLAQYGQWDGYPTGQGATICKFLQTEYDQDKFEKAVDNLKEYTQEELKVIDQVSDWPRVYPHLSRDCGAKILKMIQDGDVTKVNKDLEFAADSLMCEYAYVINLDENELEVYKGFNTSPLKSGEKFANLKLQHTNEINSKYYQVKLWATFPFAKATVEAMTTLQDSDKDEL